MPTIRIGGMMSFSRSWLVPDGLPSHLALVMVEGTMLLLLQKLMFHCSRSCGQRTPGRSSRHQLGGHSATSINSRSVEADVLCQQRWGWRREVLRRRWRRWGRWARDQEWVSGPGHDPPPEGIHRLILNQALLTRSHGLFRHVTM